MVVSLSCITNLAHWWVSIQSIDGIVRGGNWSISGPLWWPSAVMLSDCLHPRFRNLNSTVPVDVVKVKSYVKSLFNPMRVPVRVSVNKLNFAPERIMPGLTSVFRNCRSLSSWEPYWTGTTLAKENFWRQIWGKVGTHTFLSEIMRWTRIFCLPSLVRSFRTSNWLLL